MPAVVRIGSSATDSMRAVVSEKDGRADQQTGTFEVSFRLPASDRLRSGQLGSVEVQVSRDAPGSFAVPANAIFGIRAGEGLVYVVDGKNRVKQRNVQIGKLNDKSLEIVAGLSEGEVIVTRGIEKLRDGELIKPIRVAR